eukprot:scaffold18813_cov55-Phaeocystis_antarctica.AAC.4
MIRRHAELPLTGEEVLLLLQAAQGLGVPTRDPIELARHCLPEERATHTHTPALSTDQVLDQLAQADLQLELQELQARAGSANLTGDLGERVSRFNASLAAAAFRDGGEGSAALLALAAGGWADPAGWQQVLDVAQRAGERGEEGAAVDGATDTTDAATDAAAAAASAVGATDTAAALAAAAASSASAAAVARVVQARLATMPEAQRDALLDLLDEERASASARAVAAAAAAASAAAVQPGQTGQAEQMLAALRQLSPSSYALVASLLLASADAAGGTDGAETGAEAGAEADLAEVAAALRARAAGGEAGGEVP